MKNPLHRRLLKEFIDEIAKYVVIFIFMAATIGFVSGFLVADNSLIKAYDESFQTYNIEDGNVELITEAEDDLISKLEEEDVSIYNNNYLEEDTDNNLDGEVDSILRIFANRKVVNKVCLMEGSIPKKSTEIAVDRMYADNNHIKVGDKIDVAGKGLTVTGFVALSDYSALFSSNGDMMFDATKFGVAIMTEEGFDTFGYKQLHYSYSWKYKNTPVDEKDEKEKSDDFLQVLGENTMIKNYIPRYSNIAIKFTGEDMGSDKSMMITLLYIVIAIMAFVFAVTTNNTITKEATVIGTLRASGYTRGELLTHYISLPIIVTLIASVAGNLLGYTVFKDVCVDMYYGSYSLPTYTTRWNMEAFILTTVIPIIIMIVINVLIVSRKLTFSPLKFIRGDLSRSRNKKAIKLPNFKFLNRFRLRIIIQNGSSYFTLLIGIIFANVLLLFGMMVSPLLSYYQNTIEENMIAKYQYILKAPVETETYEAEKYCITSLETIPGDYESEEVSVYGIEDESNYIYADMDSNGIYISNAYADKYRFGEGDFIALKERYGDNEYEFKVKGVYEYPAAISIFMPIEQYRHVFHQDKDYYNGYFSNEEIQDVNDIYIMSRVTKDDLTKVSRQLQLSIGNMFKMMNAFSIILFALLIYLLTKLIIEKNTTSISMVKILGYNNREISRLYLMTTTWVVIISTGLSLLIATGIIKIIYRSMMAGINGWLLFYIDSAIYPKMFAMNMIAYLVVALFQFRRIKKIPMDEALKNVE